MTQEQMLNILRQHSAGKVSGFRTGQWEAIDAVVNQGGRTLLVQATGWGKSLVYFAATLALRGAGHGPTVVVSPLLSLMHDQWSAALAHGLRAATINGDNPERWPEIYGALDQDGLDILLVSPERLAQPGFLDRMAPVLRRIGLLVVDEAHCVSDWGHDFRPDYRRVRRLLAERLSSSVAVLATTATANVRVIEDLRDELGKDTRVLRGPLARPSLVLATLNLPQPARRQAWLAETVPKLAGSGIIYALTVGDTVRLARFLRDQGIRAEAYHGRLDRDDGTGERRRRLEQRLKDNELKCLVATNALGMGFDKPDLGFVLHYQRPASVVDYYQQIGRAGRAVDEAHCVLLAGAEDTTIHHHFFDNAEPPEDDVACLLEGLDAAEDGLYPDELLRHLALPGPRIDRVLRNLAVLDAPPVVREDGRWRLTGQPWRPNPERAEAIRQRRLGEWARLGDYMATRGCLMEFLTRALDDPAAAPCGRCARCRTSARARRPGWRASLRAAAWMRRHGWAAIPPLTLWPAGGALTGRDGPIDEALWNQPGRALCRRNDDGWSDRVGRALDGKRRFRRTLVKAAATLVWDWDPRPEPQWVTAVPSRDDDAVPEFARRLAAALGLPYHPALRRRAAAAQGRMANDWQRAHNLDDAFTVDAACCPAGPVLLVDDDCISGWTLAVCGALLREQGAAAVHPLTLRISR